MKDTDALHKETMTSGLKTFGFRWQGARQPMRKVLESDRNMTIESWCFDKTTMYTTAGCTAYADRGSRYRAEFVMHEFCEEAAALEVISYAMYFHMTGRSLLPADLFSIGSTSKPLGGYTHLYVSVPFFLPVEINKIDINGIQYYLFWLMPVFAAEATFIEQRGTDLFEEKFFASRYGFFDYRDDLSYLELN